MRLSISKPVIEANYLNLNLRLEQKIKPMKPDAPTSSTLPPRDAHKHGLHRIMTLGGEYGTRNYTIKHLQSLKGKTVLTETMPFTTSEAAAAMAARNRC